MQADEIIYASLADEAITVVTGQHAGTSNYRTLDELQARLDPSVFWRVHRSHLVNINKIKEIVPWFSRNYILRMKDEKATEIPGQPDADATAPGVSEALSASPRPPPSRPRDAGRGRRRRAREPPAAACRSTPPMPDNLRLTQPRHRAWRRCRTSSSPG